MFPPLLPSSAHSHLRCSALSIGSPANGTSFCSLFQISGRTPHTRPPESAFINLYTSFPIALYSPALIDYGVHVHIGFH
ncbi:hypothetical protein KSP40_PGU015378 [Platanthera guangdongensis]|uniref:Uncharacterized protein n=1 Tax=Platanthera guangdongensis TaxID=2320717 RepID=A0ABR2N4N8_9ASPA